MDKLYYKECNQHDFVPSDYDDEEQMFEDILLYIKSIYKKYDILIRRDCGEVIMINSVPNDYEFGENVFMCVTQDEQENILAERSYKDSNNE